MLRIRKRLLPAVLVLAALAGCTPDQLDQADKKIQDANAAAQALHQPAADIGGAVGGPVGRGAVEAVFGVIGLAVLTWEELRKRKILEALGAVVNGVGRATDDTQAAVKTAVKAEMQQTGDYKALNAIVDSVKA